MLAAAAMPTSAAHVRPGLHVHLRCHVRPSLHVRRASHRANGRRASNCRTGRPRRRSRPKYRRSRTPAHTRDSRRPNCMAGRFAYPGGTAHPPRLAAKASNAISTACTNFSRVMLRVRHVAGAGSNESGCDSRDHRKNACGSLNPRFSRARYKPKDDKPPCGHFTPLLLNCVRRNSGHSKI